jgi:hypothetical protein
MRIGGEQRSFRPLGGFRRTLSFETLNRSNLLLTDPGGYFLNSISKLFLPFHLCLDSVATPSHRSVTP